MKLKLDCESKRLIWGFELENTGLGFEVKELKITKVEGSRFRAVGSNRLFSV